MMSSSLSLLRAGALTTGSLEAEAVSPPSSFSAAANPDSIVGLIVSSLLFGLVHMPNSIGVWIVYAGMGLALGIAYRKFQKLEYCIMAHIINNSIAVSMLLLLQFLAPYIK